MGADLAGVFLHIQVQQVVVDQPQGYSPGKLPCGHRQLGYLVGRGTIQLFACIIQCPEVWVFLTLIKE